MAKVSEQNVHPDFAGLADTILLAADGTTFHVSSSDLARCSRWFRALFTLPQSGEKPDASPTCLTLTEDSLTVEILLKLAYALPPGLARLADMGDLERTLAAADKYEMAGAVEILLLLLRQPAMQTDALHLYAVAGRYGQTDLEDSALERLIRMPLNLAKVPHIDVPQFARLVSLRQRRIERFCSLLLKTPANAPFGREYDTRCPHGAEFSRHQPHDRKTDGSLLAWSKFVAALQGAFVRHPSVDALEKDPLVRSLSAALKHNLCVDSSCQRPLYDWPGIQARLSALMDTPNPKETYWTMDGADGTFAYEYRAACRKCGRRQDTYMQERWLARLRALSPSVDGAAAHANVQSDIKCLAYYCCAYYRQAMLPWWSIRGELLLLASETNTGIPESIAAMTATSGQPRI
ncbi:hypothetical protein AURDEDRAFT_124790 [Auricularia subglabra TFB-10046 SS5]|nr:hypothetical protein AURDEDRAFT_124790 [Auricularia subglabra TFB-10046 SS5]